MEVRILKRCILIGTCLLAVVTVFVFTACSKVKVSDGDIWESGTYYEVFNTGSAGKKDFYYRVFDKHNNTIDSGSTDLIEPNFYVNADYLRLSLNYGTGAVEYKYYDISQGLVSEVYDTVLSERFNENGILVAYLTQEDDTVAVAVRDAFDKSAFYRTLKGSFPIKFSPSTQAEFISDEQIKITYLTGEDNDEITEVFSFR